MVIISLTVLGQYKYLGVKVGALGIIRLPEEQLRSALQHITEAPHKPQQRMRTLQEQLTPKVLHRVVTSNIRRGKLRHLDAMVQTFAKGWLKIRVNCSWAVIHAPVSDGGLGIPFLLL